MLNFTGTVTYCAWSIDGPVGVLIIVVFACRTRYIVLMIANEYMMEIELENVETDERWRGEFTAQRKCSRPVPCQLLSTLKPSV